MTEDRGQMTEYRRQMADDRKQMKPVSICLFVKN